MLGSQSVKVSDDCLVKTVRIGGHVIESFVAMDGQPDDYDDLMGLWYALYLKGLIPVTTDAPPSLLPTIDLFCGAGGLALGVRQAAAEVGLKVVNELVVDIDADASASLASNHDVRIRHTGSVSDLIDFKVQGSGIDSRFLYPPVIVDPQVHDAASRAELLVAGPPCQGHSNLNNHSRRTDRRNLLMLTIPAFAVAAGVQSIVIENVPAAIYDQSDVTATVRALFETSGYGVVDGFISADKLSWPQTRRRYFIVACYQADPVSLAMVVKSLADDGSVRSLGWALEQMRSPLNGSDDFLDQATEYSIENERRIKWLFENDAYELPNSERPDCHKDGTSYGAVYGRMRSEMPAPTITSGFTTPGRGRYIHPYEPRTLTPREAAVLQGFPIGYRFVTEAGRCPSRTQLAKWIGDAVPMPLGYAATLSALLASKR